MAIPVQSWSGVHCPAGLELAVILNFYCARVCSVIVLCVASAVRQCYGYYRCTNTANGNYMQSNAGLVPSAYPLCSGQQAQHIALAASYSGADVHQASIKPGAADAEGYPGSLQAVPEI